MRERLVPGHDREPRIRAGEAEDLPVLVDIFNASRAAAGCFSDIALAPGEFAVQVRGEEIHVSELDGRPAGFVSVWRAENFIHHLYVEPALQGRGIGRGLLRACEEMYGLPLSLKCDVANARACAFYERCGWVADEAGESPDGPWLRFWLRSAQQ